MSIMGATGMTSVQVWPVFGVVLIVTIAVSVIWIAATRKKAAPSPSID